MNKGRGLALASLSLASLSLASRLRP